jgi:hypothetical protein
MLKVGEHPEDHSKKATGIKDKDSEKLAGRGGIRNLYPLKSPFHNSNCGRFSMFEEVLFSAHTSSKTMDAIFCTTSPKLPKSQFSRENTKEAVWGGDMLMNTKRKNTYFCLFSVF